MTDDWGLGWEEIICGTDTHKGVRHAAQRALTMAAENEGTLRVDIKIKFNGAPSSESAHDLKYDPKKTDLENILSDIVQSLNDYPGAQFHAQGGDVRVFFSKLGSSEKFCTWGHTVTPRAAYQNHAFPPPPRFGEDEPRPRQAAYTRDASPPEDDLGSEEPDGFGNSPNSYHPRSFPAGLQPIHQPTPIVDQQQARAWLEMMAGLNFRSQAQLLTITERVIRMMEAYTLRFGLPNQDLRTFSGDVHQAPPVAAPPSGDMGILPMLMKMAAGMAGAETPTQAITEAAKVVVTPSSPSSPNSTARKAAIRGAGSIVRDYRSGRDEPAQPARATRPNPNPPPVEPYDETPIDDHSAYNDHDQPAYPGSYEPDPNNPISGDAELERMRHRREVLAVRGRDLFSDPEPETYQPPDPPPPAFDPANLSTEEMKAAVLTWLRADPSRKGEVMAMVPDLMKEL